MVTDMGYLMFTFCMCHVNETLKDNIQATTKENNTAYDDQISVNKKFYGSHLSQNSFIGTDVIKLERERTKFVFTKFITWVHLKV